MKFLHKRSEIVKRFALLPIRIGFETRWLEFIYLYRRYGDGKWRNVSFWSADTYEKHKETMKFVAK